MQQREWITMTAREQRRAHVLARVTAGELKLWEAAVVLGLSVRQARRLKRALVREGPAALAHANRGRASPRRFSPTLRQHVVRLYQAIYRTAGSALLVRAGACWVPSTTPPTRRWLRCSATRKTALATCCCCAR